VIIGGNGDSIFKRLMIAVGKPDFAEDPAMANNQGRVENQELIDGTLAVWCGQRSSTEVVETLEAVRVPAGLIYNVADMVADPHYQARGMFEEIKIDDGEPVTLPGISPKLSETPGGNEWVGPKLGEHTEQVLSEILGCSPELLREQGLIS
jgi:crotonobetainyl-CoA:carnitine CoA-transferase CaiB-like acyl-CoA transferase